MKHLDSSGAQCTGCDDDCEQAKLPHIIGSVTSLGCCAMRFAHGTYFFDKEGNTIQEPVCCAGKNCADELPGSCDAHAPDLSKGHVIEINAPFPKKHPVPEQKALAISRKLRALSTRDETGAPTGERVADAVLKEVNLDKGTMTIIVTAMTKVINPHNPDPEWHHVAPTKDEVAKARAVLRIN